MDNKKAMERAELHRAIITCWGVKDDGIRTVHRKNI